MIDNGIATVDRDGFLDKKISGLVVDAPEPFKLDELLRDLDQGQLQILELGLRDGVEDVGVGGAELDVVPFGDGVEASLKVRGCVRAETVD